MRVVLVLGIVVMISAASGAFLVDVGPTMEEPRAFEDTLIMGVSPEEGASLDSETIAMPRAQAYYTEYRYVLGYHDVRRLLAHQQREGHEQQFGQLAGLFVTDFSTTSLRLTSEGYPRVGHPPEWVDGTEAVYVVNSSARTPTDPAILPFSKTTDAEAFVADYGGSILSWAEIKDKDFDVNGREARRKRVERERESAFRLASNLSVLKDRPVTRIVGEHGRSIQETIDNAPPQSKIIVPNGTYEEHIRINSSVTLVGSGNTTIRGAGNGTVVRVSEDRVALVDLRITGVGDSIRGDAEESRHALSMAYGGGDSAILVTDAPHTLIDGVTIQTPTTGVLVRESPESVIEDTTVVGEDDWQEGYMGVLLLSSEDCLVENSAFIHGRDGIYTEQSHGLVYQNNTLRNNRIGVHLMYTSNSVIANNRVVNATLTGIHDMTNSRYNSFTNNTVRASPKGLRTEGWYSYVAGNKIVDNQLGMTTEAANSIYVNNVLMENDVGMQGSHILPTNIVSNNDFLENERHATARRGPLRLWNGNYWEGAIGEAGQATLDRPYSPTGTVDSRLHRVNGTPTLAYAPVERVRDSYPGSLAGLRSSSIIDISPLSEPANPELHDGTG